MSDLKILDTNYVSGQGWYIMLDSKAYYKTIHDDLDDYYDSSSSKRSFDDSVIARCLGINYNKYISILRKYGGYWYYYGIATTAERYDGNIYFKEEKDALNAIECLQPFLLMKILKQN